MTLCRIEWSTKNFGRNIICTSKFYSKPFPEDNSGPQFRLMYEMLGNENRELMIYYCIWNSDFNSTTSVSLPNVTVFYPNPADLLSNDDSTMRLPENKLISSVKKPERANTWKLICSYKEGDICLLRIHYFEIDLKFHHLKIQTPNDSIVQTLTVCDFRDLLDDTTYSDVTIVANNGSRRTAHKLVLVARSKVFYAMFKHDMIESQKKEVKLDDVSPEILDIFLNFLYMGILPPNLEYKECKCMMHLGDKYGISALKILAQEQLYKPMSIDNVVEVLIIAHLHGAELLCKEIKNLEYEGIFKFFRRSI